MNFIHEKLNKNYIPDSQDEVYEPKPECGASELHGGSKQPCHWGVTSNCDQVQARQGSNHRVPLERWINIKI